jgi:hypothetical protein
MNVLLFCPTRDATRERILRALASVGSDMKVESFFSLETLVARLHAPGPPVCFIVLQVPTQLHLLEIDKFREHFLKIRVVIILPDESRELIAPLGAVHPCLITHVGSGFTELMEIAIELADSENKAVQKNLGTKLHLSQV